MKPRMLPGPRHRCSLPCGRYLLAPLTGDKEGSRSLMVLRVKPTPTRFPTNSLYTPMDNTTLHSIIYLIFLYIISNNYIQYSNISSVCHPVGEGCCWRELSSRWRFAGGGRCRRTSCWTRWVSWQCGSAVVRCRGGPDHHNFSDATKQKEDGCRR